MSRAYQKYSPEFREEVAKMVIDTSRAIADVAREYGINETTAGNWVKAYREKHGETDSAAPALPGAGATRTAHRLRPSPGTASSD